MRIIQVINVRWFNATAWYGLFLGELLSRHGHEVLMLCLPHTQTLSKVQQSHLPYRTLPLTSNNPLTVLNTLYSLHKLVSDFKPDLINCHRGESFILFGLLKKIHSFKLVRTRGDQRLPKKNIFNLWLHNKIADAVITTNTRMFKHFEQSFKTPKSKLHLVLGGVDTRRFYPDPEARQHLRAKLNWDKNCFGVGLLGRFDRVKGQKQLIQAIAHLYHKQKLHHLRLVLIGFSTALHENTIKNWLKKYNLSHISIITGKVSNPKNYINALDLGVIASLYSETIIRAGLEMMACNIPVIGTKVGVLPDILPKEALVEPNNPLQLAQKIQQCLDKNFLLSILQKEQNTFKTRLTEQHFYQNTYHIYQKLFAKN
ncbi:MAG: glycosyltransferase family 4 protein [Desulfonauticus sp.]|nr:glycosyltransferase family 4 protein [Desulfonauticus sp.]